MMELTRKILEELNFKNDHASNTYYFDLNTDNSDVLQNAYAYVEFNDKECVEIGVAYSNYDEYGEAENEEYLVFSSEGYESFFYNVNYFEDTNNLPKTNFSRPMELLNIIF